MRVSILVAVVSADVFSVHRCIVVAGMSIRVRTRNAARFEILVRSEGFEVLQQGALDARLLERPDFAHGIVDTFLVTILSSIINE